MYDNTSSAEFDQGHMYDWMADSRASSHITHQHNAFTKYQHIVGTPISVAGGLKMSAIGMGDLILCYALTLPLGRGSQLGLGPRDNGQERNGLPDLGSGPKDR